MNNGVEAVASVSVPRSSVCPDRTLHSHTSDHCHLLLLACHSVSHFPLPTLGNHIWWAVINVVDLGSTCGQIVLMKSVLYEDVVLCDYIFVGTVHVQWHLHIEGLAVAASR